MPGDFKINKAYAEQYNSWRQREELQKLKDKYGDEDEDSSSSSESEDEDAEALTQQLERDWLRTLSALKSKDPRIYQKDIKFYDDEDSNQETGEKKKKKDKPVFLKDYERKVLLEKGGVVDESAEMRASTSGQLTYHEEQEKIRKSIVKAVESSGSDSETEDGLLVPRQKSQTEKQKEEADYLEWIKGQKDDVGADKEVGVELEPLKNYWQSRGLDEGEKFLKNYILNKQYLDNDDEEMPTYDEIVNEEDEDLSDDDELLVKQADFERKYNFRFEEPDAAEVKTFPRNMEDTVRRKDTKRTEKRKEIKERKKQDKEKKREDLKQMKKLKRQEILDKIGQLQKITGNKQLAFNEDDLDEDFDPAKHDEMMEKQFNDQYYGEDGGEEVKPTFEMSDDEYDTEKWENWTGNEGGSGDQGFDEEGEPNIDDPDFCMDADYDPVADQERKLKKKSKKKHKLAQALSTKKPVFDPREKTFENYFDEYYKLDYEDIIDDIPCRFKYRKVTPNNYGLSVDEILKARDKELNAWASVKKMSQYRTEDEEQIDIKVFTAKSRNENRKKQVLTSLFETEEEAEEKAASSTAAGNKGEAGGKKKRKRGKKKKQNTGVETADSSQENNGNSQENVGSSQEEEEEKVDDGSMDEDVEGEEEGDVVVRTADNVTKVGETGGESGKKRRKRKKKKNAANVDAGVVDNSQDKPGNGSGGNVKAVLDDHVGNKIGANSDARKRKLDDGDTEAPGKKKKQKKDNTATRNQTDKASDHNDVTLDQKLSKAERRKLKNQRRKEGKKLQMSDERLKAYGINPKKYKYMSKEELHQVKPRKENKQT
ncbi:protein KRI1 homolog [Mya arenaria]|uniref:protein KRI1 homolog n=1 Tax=Mya arenaria TaxID=6604 RepID=UPI0022E3E308|nr:protein KRI1 homolog [Mya arenaria]